MFKKIIQFPYRFLRIFSLSYAWMYFVRSIFSIIMPFMCCVSFCVFAFLRALFMHNERWSWWREKKEHNYCFLVAIYGIFHSRSQTNLRFLAFLMNEFLFPFVSLIDFRNNFSSLLHTSTEMNGSKRMKKKLMKFCWRERDYGQEKWLCVEKVNNNRKGKK